MQERISNFTGIGNTKNPELKVVSVIAAYDIKQKESFMTDDLKYSNKKELSMKHETSKANVFANETELAN